MSSRLPFYRMFPKDFDTDENVRLMRMCEVGLYIRCLNHAWVNGSIPDDVGQIAKIVHGSTREVKKMWPAVSKCFTKNTAGALINPRLEEERKLAEDKSETNTSNVRKRWEKPYERTLRESDSGSISESSATTPTKQEKTSTRAPEENFIDFETLLHRWKAHHGFKKPQKHLIERAEERWGAVEITEEDLALALDGYHASDWAKQQSYPLLGFVKDPHSWIVTEIQTEDDSGFKDLQLAYPGVSIPSDWEKAKPIWCSLDGDDRSKALDHLPTCDPAYVKSPKNYLRDKEFLRPPRPEPKSNSQKLLEMA